MVEREGTGGEHAEALHVALNSQRPAARSDQWRLAREECVRGAEGKFRRRALAGSRANKAGVQRRRRTKGISYDAGLFQWFFRRKLASFGELDAHRTASHTV